jgi:hypothetical protein
MGYENPEERYPSPKGKALADMLGYSSVEEMQKAFDESVPAEPLCKTCAIDCNHTDKGTRLECPDHKDDYTLSMEQQAVWNKEHPLRCQTCDDFTGETPDIGMDQGSGPECGNPKGFRSMSLPGFPFENGCKYHSKRGIQGETAR